MDTKPMDPTLIITRKHLLRGHSYSDNYNNKTYDNIGVFGPLRSYHFDFIASGKAEFLYGFSYAIDKIGNLFHIFNSKGGWK